MFKNLILFFSGIFIAIGFNYVSAQLFIDPVSGETTKVNILKPTLADMKFATTTFENIDTATKIKEDYNNTKEITDRLDSIIHILQSK
jgi:hypothetical protein